MQSAMASASAEKQQALADAMIDDHLHQLKNVWQLQMMHDVPMEIMLSPTTMFPMATKTLQVQDDNTD